MRIRPIHLVRLLCLAMLGSLFSACSGNGWSKISPEEVRRLLPRYAILSSNMQTHGVADSLRVAAYSKFFEDEGYTLADWDSSMAWYAKNDIPLYHDFYRLASDSMSKDLARLELKSDSVSRVEAQKTQKRGYILDSVNLLDIGVGAFSSGELINQSFSVVPTTPYSGARVILSTRVAGFNQVDKKDPLELFLQLSMSDSTAIHKSIPITKAGYYEVSLNTVAGVQAVRVSGYLRGLSPKVAKGKFVFVDSLRLKRFPSVDIVTASSVGLDNEAAIDVLE